MFDGTAHNEAASDFTPSQAVLAARYGVAHALTVLEEDAFCPCVRVEVLIY